MTKKEFEDSIFGKIHENYYIKDSDTNIGTYGCFTKENEYVLYELSERNSPVPIGIYDNENDAYTKLNELFKLLHESEIKIIIEDFFNMNLNLYKCQKLSQYLLTDEKLLLEFNNYSVNHKKIKKLTK